LQVGFNSGFKGLMLPLFVWVRNISHLEGRIQTQSF